MLAGEFVTQYDEYPAPADLEGSRCLDASAQVLITDLTSLVERLQRKVDDLQRAERAGALGVPLAEAASANPFAFPIEWSGINGAPKALGGHTSLVPATQGCGGVHGVHFSRSDEHTVAAIIDMFDDARAHGRAVVVVATTQHRRWIEADLHQRCIAFEGDVCRLLDANTTLSSLLVDGEPDRDRFQSIVGALMSDVCARNPSGVSVYGEMVGLLWSRGQAVAAMRLEEFWNELQRELPFSLLCGYLIDGSPGSPDLDPIRHAHTYVG